MVPQQVSTEQPTVSISSCGHGTSTNTSKISDSSNFTESALATPQNVSKQAEHILTLLSTAKQESVRRSTTSQSRPLFLKSAFSKLDVHKNLSKGDADTTLQESVVENVEQDIAESSKRMEEKGSKRRRRSASSVNSFTKSAKAGVQGGSKSESKTFASAPGEKTSTTLPFVPQAIPASSSLRRSSADTPRSQATSMHTPGDYQNTPTGNSVSAASTSDSQRGGKRKAKHQPVERQHQEPQKSQSEYHSDILEGYELDRMLAFADDCKAQFGSLSFFVDQLFIGIPVCKSPAISHCYTTKPRPHIWREEFCKRVQDLLAAPLYYPPAKCAYLFDLLRKTCFRNPEILSKQQLLMALRCPPEYEGSG